jgi:hypothetical protein
MILNFIGLDFAGLDRNVNVVLLILEHMTCSLSDKFSNVEEAF